MKKVLLLLSVLLTTSTARNATAQSDHTITVLATGVAQAAADRVNLQLTVSSQDQTATGLFVKQNDIVSRLKKSLTAAGVSASAIHEQPFRLMPNYEYGQNGTRIISYRMETPLELSVDDISALPHLIDLSTAGGASAISVGSFMLKPGQSLHDAALRNALEDARAEGAALAKEMGRTLGEIISVAEMEDAASTPHPQRGGEEEEEKKEMAKSKTPTNTLSEKAELKVEFQLK